MVPSRSSLPALTAFARPGPGASRSPTSSLVCGHPTPSTSSAPACAGRPPVFPWASLPRDDACFCVPHGSRRDTGRPGIVPDGASEAGRRSPVARMFPRKAEGLPGYWGVHLAYVPQSNIPPVSRGLALSPSRSAAFERTETLRTGIFNDFGTATLRPASSPSYASTAPLLGQLQGRLPACWLGFGRAGFEPAEHLLRISRRHPIGIPF